MNTETQQTATDGNLEMCQVDDKTKTKARARSGMNTTAYWKARLFRNSYRDRDGNTIELPEWYCRLRHAGETKRVRLKSSDKKQAAEDALRLFRRLEVEGWTAVTNRQARLPASPTIEQFCEQYRKAATSMERAPRPVTINLYCRCLRLICRFAGVKELRQLTRDAIEHGRDAYRAEARKNKRQDSAIQNTVSKVLRNAAACFSREARGILARNGVTVANPFADIRLTQEIQPVFSLPETIVQTIWGELPLLRDGDPTAAATAKPSQRRKKAAGTAASTAAGKIDFRQPHPGSYAAVLLALGVGMRANEIDKCRWSWFQYNAKGECFVEIKEESDFKPKGGSARVIKIPREVHQALTDTRKDLASPFVLGGQENKADSVIAGENYRSPEPLETANAWLRARGIEAAKKKGNPLHRLRKQFGSELATGFGLFAAQKALGHSSPSVTAKYYSAQTEQPDLKHIRLVG